MKKEVKLEVYCDPPKKSVFDKLLWWTKLVALMLVIAVILLTFMAGQASAETIKRTCYCISNCEYYYCTPENVLYKQSGYKVFDIDWLEEQLNGNAGQQSNANNWIDRINYELAR